MDNQTAQPKAQRRQNRRCYNHDYKARCIYMITCSKSPHCPILATVDGSPDAPIHRYTDAGRIVGKALTEVSRYSPSWVVTRRIIMPDHIHFILYVKEHIAFHIGLIISQFKLKVTQGLIAADLLKSGEASFEDGYHDRILHRSGQLQTMYRYVADNPRRLLIKRLRPNFPYLRNRIIIDGIELEMTGNSELLNHPCREVVKYDRAFSSTDDPEWLRRQARYDECIREDGVLVSPFIHPQENRYRKLMLEHGGKIIHLLQDPLPDNQVPQGVYFEACAQGRALLVTPVEYHGYKDMKYSRAKILNHLAAIIAAR